MLGHFGLRREDLEAGQEAVPRLLDALRWQEDTLRAVDLRYTRGSQREGDLDPE